MVKSIPTSTGGLASTARPSEGRPDAPVSTFGAAAIGMSWQLAVVVLLPIVGGYKLDQHLGSTPLWTLAGLVLAMVGSILVIRRALQAFGNFTPMEPSATADATSKEKTL